MTMGRTLLSALTLVVIGLSACDDPPPPAPEPQPAPEADEPPEPVYPETPETTDFGGPGSFGSWGYTDDETGDVVVVPVGEEPPDGHDWTLAGAFTGADAPLNWDEEHELEECPENPIWVFGEDSKLTRVQACRDGRGYGPVCSEAQALARKRAENVVRSCERVPSCRASVTNLGQRWYCSGPAPDPLAEGHPRSLWFKVCGIQYRVTCVEI